MRHGNRWGSAMVGIWWGAVTVGMTGTVAGCPDGSSGSVDAATGTDSGQEDDGAVHSGLEVIGDPVHGGSLVIRGSGFGNKEPAAPFRASFLHPVEAQRFQETGECDEEYWELWRDQMVILADDHPYARVTGRDSHRYYARLEYSATGNWEAGGYGAGIKSLLPESKRLFLSWWDFFEPGFDASHMETGGKNFKWIYIAAGHNPHEAISVMDDGADILASAPGGVAGETKEEQNENLDLPYGGGFYARPLSWSSNYPLPVGRWYHVELIYQMNSAPGVQDGWVELRIDNQRVFKASNIDVYGGDPHPDSPQEFFANINLGGNYGYDDSGTMSFREYGDVYYDGSFARVVLCEAAVYDDCRHLELQIPTQWSDDEVTITFNEGSFESGTQAYLYLFDVEGRIHGPAPVQFQ